MSLHRRAARRDSSEAAIVEMLEACGWRWLAHSSRNGPDGFAAKRGRTVWVENKTGKAKLKPGQQKAFDDWPGEKAVIRDVEEVRGL
jgi:hypothetical protein